MNSSVRLRTLLLLCLVLIRNSMIGIDKGTPLTQYGPVWRQHRRFLNRALLAPTVKKDYGPTMSRKTIAFLKIMLERPDDFLLENKKYVRSLSWLHPVYRSRLPILITLNLMNPLLSG